MISIVAPLLIAVIGVLIYALSANSKLVEIGRIMFVCGMLVLKWILANHVYRV